MCRIVRCPRRRWPKSGATRTPCLPTTSRCSPISSIAAVSSAMFLQGGKARWRHCFLAAHSSSPRTCISARRQCDISMRWRRRRCRLSQQCRPAVLSASLKSAREPEAPPRLLLPRLPSDRVRYVFTDVSDLFLDRARQKFASYPFMEFGRLDLEQDMLCRATRLRAST